MAIPAANSAESGPPLPEALSNISDAIWIVAPNQSLSYLNKAAVRFHAEFYGTQAAIGQAVEALYPSAVREAWSERYRAATTGESVYAMESRQTDSGTLCYELTFERAVTADAQSSIVVTARSVVDRRQTFTADTLQGRAVIDSDTFILSANLNFKTLIGISSDESASAPRFLDLLTPDDKAPFQKAIDSATHDPARLDRLRIIDLNGSAHATIGTIALSIDSDHLVLALVDISPQIEAELRLLGQHDEHLRALHVWAAELNAYMEQPQELYQRSLELLSNAVQFDTASVQLLRRDELEIVASKGFPDAKKLIGLRFPSDPNFPNWHVVTSRETIALHDVGDDYPHFRAQADRYNSGNISSVDAKR